MARGRLDIAAVQHARLISRAAYRLQVCGVEPLFITSASRPSITIALCVAASW
jgi:hypothetical protein